MNPGPNHSLPPSSELPIQFPNIPQSHSSSLIHTKSLHTISQPLNSHLIETNTSQNPTSQNSTTQSSRTSENLPMIHSLSNSTQQPLSQKLQKQIPTVPIRFQLIKKKRQKLGSGSVRIDMEIYQSTTLKKMREDEDKTVDLSPKKKQTESSLILT